MWTDKPLCTLVSCVFERHHHRQLYYSFVIHCRYYFTDVTLNSWLFGWVLVANSVIWLKVEDVLAATFIVVANGLERLTWFQVQVGSQMMCKGKIGFSLRKKSAQIWFVFSQGEEVEGDPHSCSAAGKENEQPAFLVGSHRDGAVQTDSLRYLWRTGDREETQPAAGKWITNHSSRPHSYVHL